METFPPPYKVRLSATSQKASDWSRFVVGLERARSLESAKKALRSYATSGPAGLYWIEDARGVPVYGLNAREVQKSVRVPLFRCADQCTLNTYKRNEAPDTCPNCKGPLKESGHTSEYPKGETMRQLKGGNMPWGRV